LIDMTGEDRITLDSRTKGRLAGIDRRSRAGNPRAMLPVSRPRSWPRLGALLSIVALASPALLLRPASAAPARERKAKAEPAPAPAPPADAISLADVLEVAVRQSPTLASASIDVQVADAEVVRASGLEDWLLGLGASYLRRRDTSVSGDVTGTDSLDQMGVRASMSRLLSTGGTLSVSGTLDRSLTLFSFVGMETTKYESQVTARLDQPLLRGRGATVTLAAEERAKLSARAARLSRKAAAQTLVRDLIAGYWELAFAHADLDIRRSSLDLANERRRLTQAAVKLGQVAPTEVVAVDQIIAQREEEILVAELSVSQRSLELRALAGLEITPEKIDLTPSASLAVEPQPSTVSDVLADAMESSPELAALAVQGEGARLEVEVSDNDMLPRLDLALSGGPLGTAGKAADAVSNMAHGDGYFVSADLSYQQALGNHAAEGGKRRARAELHRIKVDRRDLELQLATTAVQLVKQADAAAKRMDINQRAIKLSEQNVKAETGRFELGKSTNFDVLQRQEELKQARLRYARAVVDYLRATAFIDALRGDVLDRYGIKLD
jgi:outer membrane protein